MYSFGRAFRISLFGSSHGPEIGVDVEGLPSGFQPDFEKLQRFLDRRAPGKDPLTSARKESDIPQFLGGIEDGILTGGKLTAVIPNTDVRKEDYDSLHRIPRPGHADYPAMVKYGYGYESGGGTFSGRMTAALCIAGGLALQILEDRGISVTAEAVQIGRENDPMAFRETVEKAKEAGDSVGGIISCTICGIPVGTGGPLWDGLESRLAEAVFGIPAVKGVEFGDGFSAAAHLGSENNDGYRLVNGAVCCTSNHAGGILGGMADGMPLVFRAAFKPTPSIAKPQDSVDLIAGTDVCLRVDGRHDPCIVLRAVPCVEAAAACAVLDALLCEEAGNSLAELRKQIDRADRNLIRAFDERMKISSRIGAWKRANGMQVLDSSREAAKLEAVAQQSNYPLAVQELYRTLMHLSKELQQSEDEI